MNDGGAYICARSASTLRHKSEGAATLPDLIHDQDRAPLQ